MQRLCLDAVAALSGRVIARNARGPSDGARVNKNYELFNACEPVSDAARYEPGAAQACLLVSYRPLAARIARGTSVHQERRRRPENTQEFNKERLITRDECKSAPNDEGRTAPERVTRLSAHGPPRDMETIVGPLTRLRLTTSATASMAAMMRLSEPPPELERTFMA